MCYYLGVCVTEVEVVEMEMEMGSMTPAEIDTAWLEAMSPANAVFERAVAKSSAAQKYRSYGAGYTQSAEAYEEQAAALFAKYRAMRDEVEPPFTAEWDARGGWTRAYVVPGGHIHKSTACSSLYPTTLISWVPEMSGKTEEQIVEFAGVQACTICYPSAPVEALREAERAAKAAKECPGSRGYDYEQSTFRRTSYTGSGYAVCNHCQARVSVSKIGKMKVHPKAAA